MVVQQLQLELSDSWGKNVIQKSMYVIYIGV